MKVTLFLLFNLLLVSPKIKEIYNYSLPKPLSNDLCTATVVSISNYSANCTIKSVTINGCGNSILNTINLSSGTASLNNGFTCAYKGAIVRISGSFNTIKMYNFNTGSLLETQIYNNDISYEFTTPGCGDVTILVE